MLIGNSQHFTIQLLKEQRHHKIFGIILLRKNNKNCGFFFTKCFRIQRAVKAEDLFHLTVQKRVQTGHGGGKHRCHRLIRAVERGPGKPLCLMGRRQLVHQKLKQAPVLDRGGGQQILDQFKHGNDMALFRFTVFRDQQDHRCQQPFCRIIEERILAVTAGRCAVRADNGLCCDLGILLRLCFGCQIMVVLQVLIHIFVDQRKDVVSI